MSRTIAGARLLAVILIWLIAWIPMAAYCLLAIALSPADRSRLGRRRSTGILS
jgi:hypothetical protein